MKLFLNKIKSISIFFFCLFGFLNLNAEECCHSHSFFRSRPVITNFSLEQGLTLYEWYHRKTIYDEKPWFLINVDGFYYSSTHKKQLAEYFLPNCKCAITVGQNNTSNISSIWIYVLNPDTNQNTPFSSHVSLAPKRTIFGATIDLRLDFGQYLSTHYNNESLDGWWGQLYVPILKANHRMNLNETDIENPGAIRPINPLQPDSGFTSPNVTEAFQNPAFHFGQISPCTLSMKGFGDVKLSLGYDWYETADSTVAVYGALYIPTSHGSRARHLFEPTIGNGGHVGFALGLLGDATLWMPSENSTVSLLFDAEGSYFISHNEMRSFDLKPNGDWSRYLLLANQNLTNASVQGINILTRDVSVVPRAMVDIWAALHWQCSNFNFELGYDFWWHQQEKVSTKTCNDTLDQYGIFDVAVFCAGAGDFTTASTTNPLGTPTTISVGEPNHTNGPVHDTTFVHLKVCDLNPSTAECPTAMTSTIYFATSVDLHSRDDETLGMIGLGASYEFANKKRTALNQWGIWVKVGVSF